jgi:hypothetical protein
LRFEKPKKMPMKTKLQSPEFLLNVMHYPTPSSNRTPKMNPRKPTYTLTWKKDSPFAELQITRTYIIDKETEEQIFDIINPWEIPTRHRIRTRKRAPDNTKFSEK